MSTSNKSAGLSCTKDDRRARFLRSSLSPLGLLIALFAAGCNPAPSTACDLSQTTGSITVRICIEFSDLTASEIEEADSACEAQNDPPLLTEVVDSCPKSDVLGICELTVDGMTAQEFFYESEAITAATAEQQCDSQDGVWNPS